MVDRLIFGGAERGRASRHAKRQHRALRERIENEFRDQLERTSGIKRSMVRIRMRIRTFREMRRLRKELEKSQPPDALYITRHGEE